MPWGVILGMLSCAMGTSYLVLWRGWEIPIAAISVSFSVIAVCVVALGVLMVFSKPEDRHGFWRLVTDTMRSDLRTVANWLRIVK